MCDPCCSKTAQKQHFIGNVYLSDTDAMAIAHHSRFLVWFENARIEYLADCGLTIATLRQRNLSFPVARVSVNHYVPLELGDRFSVSILAVDVKASYIRFSAVLYKQAQCSDDQQRVADSKITVACVNTLDNKSNEVPVDLRKLLTYDQSI